MSITITAALRRSLRDSIQQANARGLLKASKWSSEQLVGMADDSEVINRIEFPDDGLVWKEIALHSIDNDREMDLIMIGQSMVMNAEYQRCWHLLRSTFMRNSTSRIGSQSAPSSSSSSPLSTSSSLGLFLVCYSLFMTGEQLKGQQLSEQQGQEEHAAALASSPSHSGSDAMSANQALSRAREKDLGTAKILNPFLRDLHDELYVPYTRGQVTDPHLLYLLGVVEKELRKQGKKNYSVLGQGQTEGQKESPSPVEILVQSVCLSPLNWSCWLEIASICMGEQIAPPTYVAILGAMAHGRSEDELDHTVVPSSQALCNHWFMYSHFLVHLYLEQQLGHLALPLVELLSSVLPSSQYLLNLKALSLYCLREYDAAGAEFETARAYDPYCLDHIDTYSNILYVKEDRVQLSHLAHMLTKIGKFTPEVCCVVGNYYSLKGMHERAILSFQRALRLNPKFLSAWTLMGHEYVELRNTSSAVYCYRKAVDTSPFDYRAWYGLGQTYEMLHLYQNAVYYYRKATALKPHDARMWCAIGSCLIRLGERNRAIAAYERAVESGDRECIANNELARLYRESGQVAQAAECYLAIIGNIGGDSANIGSEMRTEGVLFLAKYYRDSGDLVTAESLAMQLASVVGREGDEARGILREIRAR